MLTFKGCKRYVKVKMSLINPFMKPAILRSWFPWWFVFVFPMCPMEAYVHVMAFITIAYVFLMCGGYPPTRPNSVTDYIIERNVIISACNCLRWWCPFSEIMACFTRLSVTLVVDIYGMFGVFHYAKILPRCIGCYIRGSDMDDAIFEAELFVKRVLISILTWSHY